MARLFISAAHKSSGKTTVSLGLCAALRSLGLKVQPFKKGPDFIDPLWLSAAAGRPCRNLDRHTMTEPEILAFYAKHTASTDISIIEGNKGLYDGVATDGHDSGAALACLLKAPVVLVVDSQGMTRGIAPLLIGYRSFDPAITIAGVILNKVSGPRHEAKLRSAVETYTDIPVLGAIRHSPTLEITERHLGLIPANETPEANARIASIAAAVSAQVDLDRVLVIARTVPHLPCPRPAAQAARPGGPRRRVGIARDAAFGFYYTEDTESLVAAGFDPVPFDTLRDRRLPPDLDGLFLGGGFPETHMEALEANGELRGEIRAAVAGGLPVYAECGGMMYLSRSITWQGRCCAMAGALGADAVMHQRPQGKGYVLLQETAHSPWPLFAGDGAPIPAHEFHYAGIENLRADTRFAYRVLRGHGITGRHDGIVSANTLASFSHLRSVGDNPWPWRFAEFMRRCARSRRAASIGPRVGAGGDAWKCKNTPLSRGDIPRCPSAPPSMPAMPFVPAP